MSSSLSFQHQFVPGNSDRALLLLHGTGGDEHDLLPLGRELDPAAALLSPRGKILENGMPRFFRRLAEGVFDEEDLRNRAFELTDFVKAAAKHYGLDARKITAVGLSNGANIAAAMLLLLGPIFEAALLFRPMFPLVPDVLPNLRGVRIQIAAGTRDPLVSKEETERLAALFRKAEAKVEVQFAGAGHGLTTAEVEAGRGWLLFGMR